MRAEFIIEGWPIASANANVIRVGKKNRHAWMDKSDDYKAWKESAILQLNHQLQQLGHVFHYSPRQTKSKGWVMDILNPLFTESTKITIYFTRPKEIYVRHAQTGIPKQKLNGEYIVKPWPGDLTGIEKGTNDILQDVGILANDRSHRDFRVCDYWEDAIDFEPYMHIVIEDWVDNPPRPPRLGAVLELAMPAVMRVSEWTKERHADVDRVATRPTRTSYFHCASCTCWIGPGHDEEDVYWMDLGHITVGKDAETLRATRTRWQRRNGSGISFLCGWCAQEFFELKRTHHIMNVKAYSLADVLLRLNTLRYELEEARGHSNGRLHGNDCADHGLIPPHDRTEQRESGEGQGIQGSTMGFSVGVRGLAIGHHPASCRRVLNDLD